jgi:hypothetical protein
MHPPAALMAALRYMSGKQLAKQRSERVDKLAWIEQQVASGELVIRQATSEECRRYGIGVPRPRRASAEGER